LVLFIITYPFDRFRTIPNQALKLLAWLVLKPVPSWYFYFHGADPKKIDRPTLVVANHQSFLDIPLLYLLPWNMKWVFKKSMLRIPVLGWMIAMTGHISINRESLRSIQAMDSLIQPIENGIPGMIFPEGTRSTDGSLQPFKRGAFLIAKKYNFQLLPVVLEGGQHAMPRGSWKFSHPATFTVSVLDPLDPSDFKNAEAMKERAHQLIKHELERIQAQ
jgi:1-acyl-sn-glycerol-3-phosphate acyltransferase